MTEDKSLLEQLRESQDSPESLYGGGKGSGTTTCYQVQARCCKGCEPHTLKGLTAGWNSDALTDTKWLTLNFPHGCPGVPAAPFYEEYAHRGYLSYAAAQALRWWFIAEQRGFSSIETRLVQYKFEYSYSVKPIRAICLVDPEKRENIMPDWGKKDGE